MICWIRGEDDCDDGDDGGNTGADGGDGGDEPFFFLFLTLSWFAMMRLCSHQHII
jgi:hypothetical protein